MIPSSRVWIKNLDRFRKDRIGYSSELKPWHEIFLSPLNEIRTLRVRIGAEISENYLDEFSSIHLYYLENFSNEKNVLTLILYHLSVYPL